MKHKPSHPWRKDNIYAKTDRYESDYASYKTETIYANKKKQMKYNAAIFR